MSFWKKKMTGSSEKFGNKRSTCALGHSHRSKLESAVCALLQIREKAGLLKLLQAEDHVYLSDARILFIPDFKCQDAATGELFWVEAKGLETPAYRLKRKLWKTFGPGRLEIFKGSYASPKLVETIIPKQNSKQ